MRQLTTSEREGTRIRHTRVGTIAVILGAYRGGFTVSIPAERNRRVMLPFEKVFEWEVMEGNPQQPKHYPQTTRQQPPTQKQLEAQLAFAKRSRLASDIAKRTGISFQELMKLPMDKLGEAYRQYMGR